MLHAAVLPQELTLHIWFDIETTGSPVLTGFLIFQCCRNNRFSQGFPLHYINSFVLNLAILIASAKFKEHSLQLTHWQCVVGVCVHT